jgi:hypothetical protein
VVPRPRTAAETPAAEQADLPTTAAPSHVGGQFERCANWSGEGMFGFRQV